MLNVGFIGCGSIFDKHLQAIKNNTNVKLVAISDLNSDLLSLRHNQTGALAYHDLHDMLRENYKKLDLITILTPNFLHAEQAIYCLENKFDVLIEKPPVLSLIELDKIINTAKTNGKHAYAVLQLRYNQSFIIAKHVLQNGLIGKTKSFSLIVRFQRPDQYFSSWYGNEKLSGGILYDIGIHYLDFCQNLIADKQKILSSKDFKHKSKYSYDTIYAISESSSGISGLTEISAIAEPKNLECSVTILGDKGMIKIGGTHLNIIESAMFSDKNAEIEFKELKYRYKSGSVDKISNFTLLYNDLINNNGINISECRNVIEIIEDIKKRL